jgi:hypothetical protein
MTTMSQLFLPQKKEYRMRKGPSSVSRQTRRNKPWSVSPQNSTILSAAFFFAATFSKTNFFGLLPVPFLTPTIVWMRTPVVYRPLAGAIHDEGKSIRPSPGDELKDLIAGRAAVSVLAAVIGCEAAESMAGAWSHRVSACFPVFCLDPVKAGQVGLREAAAVDDEDRRLIRRQRCRC